jgi:iron complex outermembrane receptor protein
LRPRRLAPLTAALLLAGGSGFTLPAQAEEAAKADDRVIEEILVVSTKRAKADEAQDVPLASTVVNAAIISENNWVDLVDIARMVPGADFRQTATFPGIQRFWLRGVGVSFSVPNFDPAVGVYQDGVFVAQNIASILDTFDMESIEVMRGPQGTLFGRNTSVGAVVTRTARPSEEFEMKVEGTLGSYNRKDFNISAGGSLIDGLARAKLAVLSRDKDGWAKDLQANNPKKGAYESTIIRGVLELTPTDALDITLITEWFERGGDGAVAMPLGSRNNGRSNHPRLPGITRDWDETWGIGAANEPWGTFSEHDVSKTIAEINWDLGHGILTSVTGYIDVDAYSGADFDGLPPGPTQVITRIYIDQEQISQELRYASDFSEKFDFTAGLYYFDQHLSYGEQRHNGPTFVTATNPFGVQAPGVDELDHDSWAAFLEGRIHFSDALILTLGGRYTVEKKDVKIGLVLSNSCTATLVPPFETNTLFFCSRGRAPGGWDIVDDEEWKSFSPKVTLQYYLNDDINTYIGWSRGQRSGGFSFRASPTELTIAARDPSFRPAYYDEEQVDNFEAGLKADLFDRRLRTNIAVYYQKWDGIQRNLQDGNPITGIVQRTANVKDSHVYGVEAEFNWIALTDALVSGDMLRIDGSIAYGKSGYDSAYVERGFDLSKDPFGAPHDTSFVGLFYEHPVGGAGATLSWRTSYFWKESYWQEGVRNTLGLNKYSSVNIVDASVEYRSADERWFVRLFGRNLTYDKVYQARVLLGTDFGLGNPDDPRHFGLTFGWEN